MGALWNRSASRGVLVRGAVIAGALAVLAVAANDGPASAPLDARPAGAQFELTPGTLPTVSPTPTPTPRVIVIDRPTPIPAATPTPRPAATSTPRPTATPIPRVITSPPATATSAPVPTLPPPTPPPLPTATPLPTQPPIIPTIAPAPVTNLTFAAEEWQGGLYRGDSRFYGRPWVAVYGAASPYPRAALTFSLEADPVGTAFVTITGLDDEWAASNEIRLEVNGAPVFTGASPFANWDGIGNGANAAWTSVPFTIPPGFLHAGRNEIAFANLTPSANVNAPPYVLLAETTLQVRGAASTLAPTASPGSQSTPFTAADWRGGYFRGDSQAYGRPWTALYGAWSDYPRATLVFRLAAQPSQPATLTLTGMDDELPALNPIRITVNGREIYAGPSPFANWDGTGDGSDAWSEATITLPADLLRAGRNEVTIANRTQAASFNAPPYILLAGGIIETPGADVSIRPGDQS